MKYIFLFSLIACSFAFSAPTSEQPAETLRLKSRDVRPNKKFTITGEVLGQGPSGAIGQGVNLGFFVSDNSLITIDLNGGRSSVGQYSDYDSTNGDWDGQEIKEGYSVGVGYKQFVGNSFYFKTGLDLRTFQYKYAKDYWQGDYRTRKFSGDSIAAGFTVGNQWQFSYFTLGCDWIGLHAPLLSKVYDVEYSANSTASDRETHRKDINRYVTGLNASLLRFYLGASF